MAQVTFVNACDICGCASSSFSMGLLPSSKHHFIGLRSSIKNFESREIHALSSRFDSEQHFPQQKFLGDTEFHLSFKYWQQFLTFIM